ncbi:MAG: winged helix-turn-helix domain-containing protein [Blastocatellia bacterium]|nr:winged helix-turn-helix domain-containing protein [Blastocatellia bacterium]
MLTCRLTIIPTQRAELEKKLKQAEQLGNGRLVRRVLAILALAELQRVQQQDLATSAVSVGRMLKVTTATVLAWARQFVLYGVRGLHPKASPGRPAKLTPTQKAALAQLIEVGPQAAGLTSGCWRTPQLQHLIQERFGVFYHVRYLSELLNNLGFSFQKARFVSDHLNEVARWKWQRQTWPAPGAGGPADRRVAALWR